jgi:glycine cleavage system aminomethyltransferase T
VALAYVRREHAAPGTTLAVEEDVRRRIATVAALPLA